MPAMMTRWIESYLTIHAPPVREPSGLCWSKKIEIVLYYMCDDMLEPNEHSSGLTGRFLVNRQHVYRNPVGLLVWLEDSMKMSKNDMIMACLREQRIIVDATKGIIYRTRKASSNFVVRPYKAKERWSGRYFIISLAYKGQQQTVFSHRVIWMSVHGRINSPFQVNHRDHNSKNNSISNLEIVTNRGNSLHHWMHGGHDNGCRQFSCAQVKEIREFYSKGVPTNKLAVKYKCSTATIYRIKSGIYYKHCGGPTSYKPYKGAPVRIAPYREG